MTEEKKPKRKRLNYFFYKGELHKKIHINRSADIITAWSYPRGQVVKHLYSDVKRNGEKAYSSQEVSKLVRRHPRIVKNTIVHGHIPSPQRTYGIDENRNGYAYYWSEKDIMTLHDYLKTVHIGRPRKDGLINTGNLPSAAELRAEMRQGTVFYVRTEDGEFVQTWKAERF